MFGHIHLCAVLMISDNYASDQLRPCADKMSGKEFAELDANANGGPKSFNTYCTEMDNRERKTDGNSNMAGRLTGRRIFKNNYSVGCMRHMEG